ncbi:uncharacterized protein LOC119581150 [Penaeus monodon]|uniref:uncharacterized protein LOC119581150 n=1 Tax=Penaeus monodon TaxID=6687 RepID=UPI0018A75382|nr:uncharacterized protein LOC119581150 [Penaeus monodon]XP_037785432.1 uncharacterized protein LOC119581150 [Penaeus monodon]
MIIYIREKSGKTTAVKAAPSDTVRDLKIKIMQKGISLKFWDLMYFDEQLYSTKKLSDYGIKHKDTLYLKEALRGLGSSGFLLSIAQPSGDVMKMVVNKSDCVIDIKQEVEREGGPGVASQLLKVGDVEMQNEKTLMDYGIAGDAVIWLEDANESKRKSKEERKRKRVRNEKLKKRLIAVVFVIIFIIILIWAYLEGKIQINP